MDGFRDRSINRHRTVSLLLVLSLWRIQTNIIRVLSLRRTWASERVNGALHRCAEVRGPNGRNSAKTHHVACIVLTGKRKWRHLALVGSKAWSADPRQRLPASGRGCGLPQGDVLDTGWLISLTLLWKWLSSWCACSHPLSNPICLFTAAPEPPKARRSCLILAPYWALCTQRHNILCRSQGLLNFYLFKQNLGVFFF